MEFHLYQSKEQKVSNTLKEQLPWDSWVLEHPILHSV